MKTLDISDEDRQKIMCDNAIKMFNLKVKDWSSTATDQSTGVRSWEDELWTSVFAERQPSSAPPARGSAEPARSPWLRRASRWY